MTIDEIKKWMLESSGFPVTQANVEYLERFQAIAFKAGAASRDAEVAKLKDDNEYLYVAAIERDQLREQAKMLRDFIASAQVSSGVCCCGDAMDGHASPMVCGHSPVDMWDYAVENLLDAPSDTSTPEQSLAEYRNKVIEECACIFGGPNTPVSNEEAEAWRNPPAAIRALKEQP